MAKAFITIIAALLLLATPALAEDEHKDLKIGMSQFPSTLHPFFDEMVAKSLVLGGAVRPVTVNTPDWKPACMLCTELPTYENGRAKKETRKDGKKGIAATYTLKDELYWGDGTPVTTKDIIFAWEVGKHPKSGVGNGEFFSKDIVDIDVKDAKTFTIHFDKEKCDFAPINDFYPLPAHIEKAIFDKDPEKYKSATAYNTDSTNAGLYLGPYRIGKVESGAAITLERNAGWKGAEPYFDTVKFRAIENSASLQANLLAGDIDYIAGELGMMLDEALSFEKRLMGSKPGQFTAVYKPSLTFEHIDLNLDLAPFNDLKVRKALLYGIDREQLNREIFGGKQPVAASDINPLDTVYTADVTAYNYDPAKAEALLEEAGWKKGGDGYRRNAEGKKLDVVLSTTAGNQTREVIAQALKSAWKKVGVDATIDLKQARVLFGDVMRKRKYEGGVMYAWMSAPRNIPKTTLYSSMVPTEANNFAGQNYSGYKNPAMDKLIDDLDTVCGEKENLALWHTLQKLYADDLPALPLYYRADSFFIPTWLKGIEPTGHLNPSTLWIENWKAG
jgi:peptide/nickel transport system substrate-binding protein